MSIRIGEILVRKGVLNPSQVEAILEKQLTVHRPFGKLAEEIFEVPPEAIESAWLTQYELSTDRVDPLLAAPPDPEVLATVSRRQAWQFRVLPLERDHGELTLCTTAEHLGRTLRFATNCLGEPSVVVLTEPILLSAALSRHYPIEGFDTEDILDAVRAVC